MKRNVYYFFISSLLLLFSCSSENDEIVDDVEIKKDSVEVSFKFSGIEVSNKPICRGKIENSKTYYHIRIEDTSESNSYTENIGYVGLFDNLELAKIRLVRGTDYIVHATALVEDETQIDLEKISTITSFGSFGKNEYNIYNCFSHYLTHEVGWTGGIGGAKKSPDCTDQSVDRYYNEKNVTVTSNETINIELKRFSYKLKFEIDAPSDGYIELSCNAPAFNHRVGCNDEHFSRSTFYSLGGTDLLNASKDITLKLEHFNSEGISTKVSEKNITVNPNVETTINVNYDQFDAKNGFNLTLDSTPLDKEEIYWN